MTTQDRCTRFRQLHISGQPLLMANPWDAGSARVLESMGFVALGTTSQGFAGTVGRRDGGVERDEALGHAAAILAAVDVPVSADLEGGFATDAAGVAETVRLAAELGLAGCSIEDYDSTHDVTYAVDEAAERVAAAAEAAHAGARRLVLTARADGHLHGSGDLDDTIARLQAFEDAGADVLYAPAVSTEDGIRRILDAVSLPVNVLALPDAPGVRRLAELGVARVSVGSGFYWAAMGELVAAGRELLESGTYRFWESASRGAGAGGSAFS